MSHIDSFKHEIVGRLGKIAVYHPLQKINGEFICGPDNILIGGGSGEWPAIIIKNPKAAVAEFLSSELSAYDLDDDEVEWPIVKVKEHWLNVIDPHLNLPYNNIIEFCEWTVEDYVRFQKHCCSEGLQNPFDTELHELGFENWLILGVGEFVFYAMPELANEIVSKLIDPYNYFSHITYNNILLIPPNMPVHANEGNYFFAKNKT